MKKGLKIAAILLPLLLLAVAAGIVITVNAGLSRRLTERLPLLVAQVPGVASYRHKAVRYNILTDALTIEDATLEFSGRSARIFWESLKIKGLRTYLLAEVNWAEADWPILKSAQLRGLGLESGGKTQPVTLVCRELEIKRLTMPRLSLKQLQGGDLSRALSFDKLVAAGFEGRFDWGGQNRFNLSFDHLKLLGQSRYLLELGQVANLKLAVGRHNLDLATLVVRNLDFTSGPEATAGPWPWPVGLDLLEIRQAVWGGFSKTPWSVKHLAFKGCLERGRWPEQAGLKVEGARIMGDWPLFQLLEFPAVSFKAKLSREREPDREVAHLVVSSGHLKKYLEWTADVKMVVLDQDSVMAEPRPAVPGLAWARFDLREDGLGHWLATVPPGQTAGRWAKFKNRLYLNAWEHSLRALENPQELRRMWEIFAQPNSAESLTITANPGQPWSLRPTVKRLWRPIVTVNELGLNVRLSGNSESWPIKFKD